MIIQNKTIPKELAGVVPGYFQITSPSVIKDLNNKIFAPVDFEERKKAYDDSYPTLKQLADYFPKLVEARNKIVQLNFEKPNQFQFFISQYGISEDSLKIYFDWVDRIIDYMNTLIPNSLVKQNEFWSEFNHPHFLGKSPMIEMQVPEDVLRFVSGYFPIINSAKINLQIGSDENKASFKLDKNSHAFDIQIPKTSHNQSIAMIIHELSHVISLMENNFDINTDYHLEKLAFEKELFLAKKISNEFYEADLLEYLASIGRTIFEINAYTDPHGKLGVMYADSMNKIYHSSHQKENLLYTIDEAIVMHPFGSFHHTVAIVNLLRESL